MKRLLHEDRYPEPVAFEDPKSSIKGRTNGAKLTYLRSFGSANSAADNPLDNSHKGIMKYFYSKSAATMRTGSFYALLLCAGMASVGMLSACTSVKNNTHTHSKNNIDPNNKTKGISPQQQEYGGKPWDRKPQVIPGRLEFELFDIGGQGISFFDSTPTNRGNGDLNLKYDTELAKFRRDGAVDVSFTKPCCDKDSAGNLVAMDQTYVGWIVPGEWIKYTINVQQTGSYRVSGYFGINPEPEVAAITFLFNDKAIGPIAMAPTGGYHIWEVRENLFDVELTEGSHVLTILIDSVGELNLDWLEFVKLP
jgi:hypothetical protein